MPRQWKIRTRLRSPHPEPTHLAVCLWPLLFALLVTIDVRSVSVADEANASAGRADPDSSHFESQIKPILAAKCFSCHGSKTRKAELDLSTVAGIQKGGESGASLDSEHPAEGLFYEYIADGTMPPDGEPPLSDEERQSLLDWVKQGAPLPKSMPGSIAETSETLSQHDVVPILLLRCAVCHGGQRQQGELDVRTKTGLLKGGKSGPAIVPGDPAASLLIQKVHTGEMPPKEKLASYSVKPVSDAELETLTRWISEGAREVELAPDIATTEPDPLVSNADRDFWAFQSPFADSIPAVTNENRVRNPIDAFVLSRLEDQGLTLNDDADRQTLIRRVYFDLTGLPSEPADVDAFLQDSGEDAYERLVDKLLASPRYGERWGQYWLDLAGYSDSEGVQHADPVRKHAWRYRDYVIRAFNSDKPYNQFLREQLAGDELADYENAKRITPELYDNLVATGFLRLAPDGTNASITAFVPDRLEIIDDEIEIFSSAVLGLTIRCARCHTHKFDPIPHRDYYRLAAIFKGAYDENEWMTPTGDGPGQPKDSAVRHLPQVLPEEQAAWQAAGGDAKEQPMIRALWDRGSPSETYILKRGNYLTRGRLVGPGVPSVLTDGKTPLDVKPPWPGAKSTGRRLALANWVTSPDHPLTARVMVNRIWKHHFGAGIVTTLDNFGKTGAPPTHPRLLDWLAVQFVEQGWSIKSLHRLLMTSSTYRQSSGVTDNIQQRDPENRLLSRMPLQRMEGEVLRDTLLFVSGCLDETPFGPADPLDLRDDGLVTAAVRGGSGQKWRRSIYLLKRRTQPVTILQNFDIPTMNPNCINRSESIVAPQALHLNNNHVVHTLAAALAQQVIQQAGSEAKERIRTLFRIMLSRWPTADEETFAIQALTEIEMAWSKTEEASQHDAEWLRQKSLENLCHTMLNSASFLYID